MKGSDHARACVRAAFLDADYHQGHSLLTFAACRNWRNLSQSARTSNSSRCLSS